MSLDERYAYLTGLAKLGIPVIPVYGIQTEDLTCLCPDRAGCVSPGKHPMRALAPNGVNSGSTDLGVIKDWVNRGRQANWAICTGHALKSGGYLVGLDIDPRNYGDETLGAIEAQHGKLPNTARVITGGGGYHYYFKSPHPQSCRVAAPGIDFKATGGYLLSPPSLHQSGKRYVWDVGGGFDGNF